MTDDFGSTPGNEYSFAVDSTGSVTAQADHVGHQFDDIERRVGVSTNPLRAGLEMDRMPDPCVMVDWFMSPLWSTNERWDEPPFTNG